jgi:adenylate cyclase
MMFRGKGAQTARLRSYLKKRERTAAGRRPALDSASFPTLFRKQAVVFTDTADFTLRTARDGILHFLMVFNRLAEKAEPVLKKHRGRLVKIEGDSLLACFPDVEAACRGVDGIEGLLRQLNRGRSDDEQLRFSYGVGYGEILDLEEDLFGLEVNLASKVGEDLARPGEALLTPSAAASLGPTMLRRVVPYRIVTFGKSAIPINRLKLKNR